MSAIEARVETLERKNRRLSMALVALAIALISLPFVGAATRPSQGGDGDTFTVRDSKGRIRVALQRKDVPQAGESFGLFFFGETGENLGALRITEGKLGLFCEQSAERRQAESMLALRMAEQSLQDKDKAKWERQKPLELERVAKMGKLLVTFGTDGLTVFDEGPEPSFTQLNQRGLSATSAIITTDIRTAFLKRVRGNVTVMDGNVTVTDTQDGRSAVLGSTTFGGPNGATLRVPASSLILRDGDGKVTFQAPK